MAYVALVVLVLAVALLARSSLRRERTRMACCAPADPADDLRMRAAFDDSAANSPLSAGLEHGAVGEPHRIVD